MLRRFALLLTAALLATSACDESARETTNDYYRNREAKRVIDSIVEAHGGESRLRELERASAHWSMAYTAGEGTDFDLTLYQTRDSIRRDMKTSDELIRQVMTPTDSWMTMDDQDERVSSELHDQLRRQIDNGILQQQLLTRLLDFRRHVVFHGKKRLNDKDYWLIATRDPGMSAIEHYYSADDFLEEVEVARLADGRRRVTLYKSYRRHNEIVYPEEVETRENDGDGKVEITATMRLLNVTSDFDDSVFARPADAATPE